jgi:hypothetical protein
VKNVIGRLPPPDPFWAELGRRVLRERDLIAFMILALAAAWAFLLIHDNYEKLCTFAELSRSNQIASAVDQAETLISFAVDQAIMDGASPNDPEVARLRDVTGPAYVRRIRENHEKRLPPVAHFCRVLR